MKRKLLSALLFIGGLCITGSAKSPATTQLDTRGPEEPVKFVTGGPVLEANFSGFLHSGTRDGRSRMKTGCTVGGFISFGINRSFSIQGELLLHYKTSDFSWSDQGGRFRYSGAEVPIYAMYHYNFAKGGRIFAGIGPHTEFGFYAAFRKGSDLYEKKSDSGLAPLHDSNSGFGIKIGYELPSGLQIVATYKASITNLLDENSSIIKMYPQAFSAGLAYRFGK